MFLPIFSNETFKKRKALLQSLLGSLFNAENLELEQKKQTKRKMSLCGICYGEINDGDPYTDEYLGYDGCEEDNWLYDYTHR